ncbi:MAG TPA: hypothetical protein PKZ77_01985 [Pseudomonadales bacterium]|nr:hypothetical protein [Pseudomonadales bacterium]HNC69235.1 hypothetical protein [Pseudomonadales bacterium]HND13366.1 hypothetical protein [Pseudomonadales bacterium]
MQYDCDSLSVALTRAGGLARDFDAVWERIWQQDHVPPRSLELCRMRLATLHGTVAEAGRMRGFETDPQRCAAVRDGSYADSPLFDASERALLAFAEVYAQDAAAIDDELADAVKRHHGEAGLVCLIESLGFIDARIRLAMLFSALGSDVTAEESP